mmetsp:Transcript_18452/g.50661  ORF Transcript_18452/g.50661 Transcript_18452/m.50661 type:complete len:575 (-) Transcript_18452:156-1880(-)
MVPSLALLLLLPMLARGVIDVDVAAIASRMVDGGVDHRQATCLLQIHNSVEDRRESCVALSNMDTFFSVPVCVGTPPQCFDLVADTGSDSVIIPSCVCGEMPNTGCSVEDKCFRGTNKSESFFVKDPDMVASITFGSGTIQAIVGSDIVKVGTSSTKMENGVLLMVDRSQLRIAGEFQGILGLGVPPTSMSSSLLATGAASTRKYKQAPFPFGPLEDIFGPNGVFGPDGPFADNDGGDEIPKRTPLGRQHPRRGRTAESFASKLFLQEAEIDRFSMCFRDGGDPGVLRLAPPPFEKPVKQIGQMHWGMDFRGVSVGPKGSTPTMNMVFCGEETMQEGMTSPCGVIPDSGTTLITGPAAQVAQLLGAVCDAWPRCSAAYAELPHRSRRTKDVFFRMMLMKCSKWLTESEGLYEIPSLFFHVQGADGAPETFELTAWAYVTEMQARVGDDEQQGGGRENKFAWLQVMEEDPTLTKVCAVSIGSMEEDYVTQMNGPIWILGSPLFYEYVVGFDLKSMSVSLTRAPCEECRGTASQPENTSLITARGALQSRAARRFGRPRAMNGRPRVPTLDVSLPL